jgi:hypothetical protein
MPKKRRILKRRTVEIKNDATKQRLRVHCGGMSMVCEGTPAEIDAMQSMALRFLSQIPVF